MRRCCCAQVGKSVQTLSGSTTSMAALADCAKGERLTVWSAYVSSAACTGVILGGLLETAILLRGYTARATYAFMSACGLAHTLIVLALLRETLPPSQRSSERSSFKSPLGCFKLFRHGSRLRLAALSCAFGNFADGANLNDIDQMWIKQDVTDMGLKANSVYLTLWGLAGTVNGFMIPPMLRILGERWFTTLTTFTNFLAMMTWGGVPRMWGVFTALAFHLPGIDGNSSLAVRTEATELGVGAGMGRGEFAGYYGSLRALTVAIGPFIFGNLYAWGRTVFVNAQNQPRYNLGFFAAAVLGCIVPEIFHQMLRGAKDRPAQREEGSSASR